MLSACLAFSGNFIEWLLLNNIFGPVLMFPFLAWVGSGYWMCNGHVVHENVFSWCLSGKEFREGWRCGCSRERICFRGGWCDGCSLGEYTSGLCFILLFLEFCLMGALLFISSIGNGILKLMFSFL